MRQTKLLATTCLIGLTAGVVLARLLFAEQNAAAQAPQNVQKWDYAILSDGTLASAEATWETSKNSIEAKNLHMLHLKLAGKEAPGLGNRSAFLSYLGQEGWELVSHSAIFDNGARHLFHTWTFKRPAR